MQRWKNPAQAEEGRRKKEFWFLITDREVTMRTCNETEKCRLEKLLIIEGGQWVLAIPTALTRDSNFPTEDQKNKCCPLDKHIKDSGLWPHSYLCACHFVNIHVCTLVCTNSLSASVIIFSFQHLWKVFSLVFSLLGMPLYLDDAFSWVVSD